MVCEWGMSDRMGPLAFGKKEGEVFLGRDMASTQTYSEQTAREIDAEVRRIVTEQYERARVILLEKRESLDKIAEALLEHETLDLADVDLLLSGGAIERPPPPTSPPPPAPAGEKEKARKGGLLGGLGGLPKAEPGKA
jgi:cell division protease FtsH